MFVPNRELGSFLVDSRLLSRAEFDALLRDAQEKGSTLYEIILLRQAVPEDALRRAAAHVLGVPYGEVSHQEIDPDALMMVPEPLSREHFLALASLKGHEARVLLLDLDDLAHLNFLEQEQHLALRPQLTDRASIKRALLIQQRRLKERFASKFTSESADTVLEALLSHARLSRARTIYVEEEAGGHLRVRYRIAGHLREAMRLPAQALSLISKLKELAQLSFTLPTPQEGRFKVTLKSGEMLRVGVFTLRAHGGESMRLEVAEETSGRKGFALESLGLHGEALEHIYDTLSAHSGLVLVASPQGGGKTTALYTLLDHVASPMRYATSVEENIELVLPHTTQVMVKPELGLTTASTLRAALRHHPDVVMIHDIADEESAALALSAASRGVLVLAGIEAPSASEAIKKMLSLEVDPLLLAATLRAAVATEVVRKLCPHCKQHFTPKRADIAALEGGAHFARILSALKAEGVVEQSKQWKDLEFYKPVGCPECEDGYLGTLGLEEVLPTLAITRELIVQKREGEAHAQVPLTLIEDGIFKAAQGLTSLEEVERRLGE